MPIYILVPFGVFFCCCASQFWFLKRVRDRLIDQHPDHFLAVERSSFFPNSGIFRYTFGSRLKALNDPELNKRVRDLRLLYALTVLSWLALALTGILASSST